MLPMFARCNHSTSIFMEALLFKAYPNVESSTYSISEPDGSPRASLVISMSMLDNESRMKEAVASPNNVGFVAIINSLILEHLTSAFCRTYSFQQKDHLHGYNEEILERKYYLLEVLSNALIHIHYILAYRLLQARF